jgi:hypothetical protein
MRRLQVSMSELLNQLRVKCCLSVGRFSYILEQSIILQQMLTENMLFKDFRPVDHTVKVTYIGYKRLKLQILMLLLDQT